MFKNPFSFKGRIRRTEFGISFIIVMILHIIIPNLIDTNKDSGLILLFIIPLNWFLFAQGSKREHDLCFSGWYQIIPFRHLWLIFIKGQIGDNKYGVDPKKK